MGIFGTSYNKKFEKESDFQREQLQNQQDFTERMWNQTNDWNLAQWNRENEYNSPAAQLQRFLDAGINPNNAAQALAGDPNSASQLESSLPGSPATPSAPSPTGTDVIGNATSLMNSVMGIGKYVDSERAKTKAETKNVEANTEKTYVDMEKTKEEVRDLIFKNDFLNDEERRLMISMYEKNMADKALTESERDEIKERLLNMAEERSVMKANIRKIDAEIEQINENIKLLKENVKVAITEAEKNKAQTALFQAQKNLADMQADKTAMEAEAQDQFNDFEAYLQSHGTSTKDPRSDQRWASDQLHNRLVDSPPVERTHARSSKNHKNP